MSKLYKNLTEIVILGACLGLAVVGVFITVLSFVSPETIHAPALVAGMIGVLTTIASVVLIVSIIKTLRISGSIENLSQADAEKTAQQELVRKRTSYFGRMALAEQMRDMLAEAVILGKRVVEVGDSIWLSWVGGPVTIVAAVKLEGGKCLIVGVEDGTIVIPKPDGLSWILDNLSELPRLEQQNIDINVWYCRQRYLRVSYARDTARRSGKTTYSLQFVGVGRAAEHGKRA